MDKILQNWDKFLNEQTEPYQRKMKAGHSRKKKRVIGHGGQKAGPPYTNKPSMERSKSAPPIGEGLFDFFKKKKPEEEADEYIEGPQIAKGYTFLTNNLAVGSAPMKYGVISKNALKTFDKIYIMSDQVAELLTDKDSKTLEDNKDKIILMPVADIDQPIDDREAEKLIEHDNEIQKAIQAVANDIKNPSTKVLVTCSMGLNRSATVAAGALVANGNMDAEAAIDLVKNRRGEKALSINAKPHQRFMTTIRSQKKVEEVLRSVIRRIIREQYGRERYPKLSPNNSPKR